MWTDLVLVVKVVGGLLAFALLVEAVYQFFDRAGKAWRQRQIDDILAENARVSRREQRLRVWRQRDLTAEEQADSARRLHLVMHNSSKRVN